MEKLFIILMGSVLAVTGFTLYGFWRIGKIPVYPRVSGIALLTIHNPDSKIPSRIALLNTKIDSVGKKPRKVNAEKLNPEKGGPKKEFQGNDVREEFLQKNNKPIPKHELLRREAAEVQNEAVLAKQIQRGLKNVETGVDDAGNPTDVLEKKNGKYPNKLTLKPPHTEERVTKERKTVRQVKTKGHFSKKDIIKLKDVLDDRSKNISKERLGDSSRLTPLSLKIRDRNLLTESVASKKSLRVVKSVAENKTASHGKPDNRKMSQAKTKDKLIKQMEKSAA